MKRVLGLVLISISCGLLTMPSHATVGAGVRVSTFGFGADLDVSASKWATLRLGYHGINYGREITDTDIRYDGKMKINAASFIVDWNIFAGNTHVSLGAVSNGPTIDVTGTPTNGTYTFNGTTYQASDIGSLRGTINMGKTVSPYIGLGWGNVVGDKHSITFLFDIGAIHTGAATATLNVTCNPALPSVTCDQITADASTEKNDLENRTSKYRWYPVIGVGFGVKF